MTLQILDMDFSILRLNTIPENICSPFTFFTVTDREISLVCPTDKAPSQYEKRDDGWKGFRVEGVLDFSLIGILAEISRILAENKIGIFVCSTYDTDYVFVKEFNFEKALDALSKSGYIIAK
ncbi:MAG: ACT domain-containing protein [Firmicutes bacterium]|nr:ACT domain-containing protein [Bacillota bacterium]